MSTRVDIRVSPAAMEYFLVCARIRGVSRAVLLRRLLHTVAHDQMVGSVLDDENDMKRRRPGEHRYKHRHKDVHSD